MSEDDGERDILDYKANREKNFKNLQIHQQDILVMLKAAYLLKIVENMKRLKLIVLLVFINNLVFSQITTIDEMPKAIAAPPAYDSSYFDANQNVKMYIGSKIYIVPFNKKYNPNYKTPIAYLGFMKEEIQFNNNRNDFEYNWKNVYKIDSTYSRLNSDNSILHHSICYSKEEALSGRIFNIIDAENFAIEKYDYLEEHPFYFQLMSEDENDTLYFYYSIQPRPLSHPGEMPFYFVETYEKLKKTFKGEKLVRRYDGWEVKDIRSGLKIEMKKNSKWKCEDVAFINPIDESNPDNNKIKLQQLGLILTNELSQAIFLPCQNKFELQEIFNKYAFEDELISEYNNWLQRQEIEKQKKEQQKNVLIEKYGHKYGLLISERKVEIGMTKEMCKKAWGEPYKVDKITTNEGVTEFWHYTFKSLLTFRDDKLTIIRE